MENLMVLEYSYVLMGLSTRGSTKMGCSLAKEFFISLMEHVMKANTSMDFKMEMEYSTTQMEKGMKASGKMGKKMEREWNSSPMGINTRESGWTERKMEKACIHITMETFMSEIIRAGSLTEKQLNTLTKGKSFKANFLTASKMVKVHNIFKMEMSSKDNIKMG